MAHITSIIHTTKPVISDHTKHVKFTRNTIPVVNISLPIMIKPRFLKPGIPVSQQESRKELSITSTVEYHISRPLTEVVIRFNSRLALLLGFEYNIDIPLYRDEISDETGKNKELINSWATLCVTPLAAVISAIFIVTAWHFLDLVEILKLPFSIQSL